MEDYNPEKVENRWRDFYIDSNIFTYSNPVDYTIDCPPPTASGSLHMGHVYQYVIQDISARFRRLKNEKVFFPIGFDNNGIATERFVERQKDISRTEVGDEEFSKYHERIVSNKIEDYKSRMENLGISVDWENTYQTINDSVKKKSQLSFIDLYESGREYRERTPSIWCPECETAISQAETGAVEESSAYHRVEFEVVGGSTIPIETTRPELLCACVSIFISPEHNRSDELVGEKVITPIFNQKVEIRADDRVDIDEGSGVVMCCTFGDTTDIEWYKSHDLGLRVAVSKEGKMTSIANSYEGLTAPEAREKIVEELNNRGKLKNSKTTSHNVQVHDRCGTKTEYRVTSQWYIRMLDRTDKYLEIADEMEWYPQEMKTRYRNWVNGLEWDWCVSRQRDVGIPIPAWYCKNCETEILPDESRLPIDPESEEPEIDNCSNCGHSNFEPETDVFDTWSTSSITPLINAGWNRDDFGKPDVYPMTVRPQGHDIISTWLFYTIVKCYEHTGEPPFEEVLVNGHVLDENMEKMSASRGNVVEPDTVMSEHSIDSIRYWCAGVSVGSDFAYKEQNLESGEKLVRKLWNASNLVSKMTPELSETVEPANLEHIDIWMLARVSNISNKISEYYREYEYEKASRELRAEFWHTFCDDFLEIAKQRELTASLKYTLQKCHKAFVKMFHPIVPYVCEEIWNNVYTNTGIDNSAEDWSESAESIQESNWPRFNQDISDKMRVKGKKALTVISSVRDWKSSNGVALNEEIDKITVLADLSEFENAIQSVTHANTVRFETSYEVETQINLDYSNLGPEFGEAVSQIEDCLQKDKFEIKNDVLKIGGYSLSDKFYESKQVPKNFDDNIITENVPLRIEN